MKLPGIIGHFFGQASRKVAFGWHLFAVANFFLYHNRIDASVWQMCVFFSSALIGGGTIADTFMKNKADTIKPQVNTNAS